MLVLSKGSLSAGQAEHYYQEKYSQDDYYTEEQKIAGEWFGEGATTLGLRGEVTIEDFRRVLAGQDPRTGQVLVPPTADGKHRAGWDATFNAPKSVSLQVLIGGDERLREAHQRAVKKALVEFEKYTQARSEGGSRDVQTGNMVAAQFEHIAARPSRSGKAEGVGPDPHLHTHVVIANMTKRGDQWRAVQPLDLYRSQSFATAVYRSEVAQETQRLGYVINITNTWGEWEIEGYSREQIMAFSRRRQDIEQQLAAQGLTGSAAAQIAAHQTRLTKDQRSDEAIKKEWQQRAEGLGLGLAQRTEEARARTRTFDMPEVRRARARAAVTYAHNHLTEREAVMQPRALETVSLQRGMGVVTLDVARQEISQQTTEGILIPVERGITTRDMRKLEQQNIALMQAGQGTAPLIVTEERALAWARDRGLYADQTEVVKQTVTSRNWITAIEGKAGSTKTTTIGAMTELYESQGYIVRGFGPTTGSVKALQEAGAQSQTVASLSHDRDVPWPRQVWLVDESSLLSTRQVNGLLRQARDAQVTRVIFVGDQRQHGAIEAGRPIAQLQAAGMKTSRLDIIRRQRDPELRKAVELAASGKIAESVVLLQDQGRVKEIADTEHRYEAIALEYARSVEAEQQVLAVSPANAERTALNETIRKTLQAKGHVAEKGVEHKILISKSLTGTARKWARNYEVGDVVRYRMGSPKRGMEPGTYARVVGLNVERNELTVRTEAGQAFTYSPATLKSVEVYREEDRTFAAGDRIQFRVPLKEQHIANGALGALKQVDPDTGNMTIALDAGKQLILAREDLRHIEMGYAVTSHSSQGATIDRVLVNVDTEQSQALVNRQQFYVSLSRARRDATVFTNKQDELAQAVNRSWTKTTAIEMPAAAKQSYAQTRKPEYTIERPAVVSRGMGRRR